MAVFKNQKNAYIVQVTLPCEVLTDVKLFAGTLFASELSGNFNAQIRFGEIKVKGLTSLQVLLHVGIGDITVQDVGKKLIAQTRIGDINIAVDQALKDTNITAKDSFIGDIALWMPGGQYKRKLTNGFVKGLGADVLQVSKFIGDRVLYE